ncbi:MAG: immunoglobulin-like domain-containing protein [bacterium]
MNKKLIAIFALALFFLPVKILAVAPVPIINFISSTPSDNYKTSSTSAIIKINSDQALLNATLYFGLPNGDFEFGNLNNWITGGAVPWKIVSDFKYGGSNSAKNGDININEQSWLKRTVDIRTTSTVSFFWSANSNEGHAYLRFFIDNVEQNNITSNIAWEQKTYLLSPGVHELKWQYDEDGLHNDIVNDAWLDNVDINAISTSSAMILADSSTTASYILNDLSEGQYYYQVRARSVGGWATTSQQMLIIDQTAPVLTLNGSSTVTMPAGSIYTDMSASAVDNIDTNIVSNIVTSTNLNVNVAGTYYYNYSVSDSAGNTATTTRTIIVDENTTPAPSIFSFSNPINFYNKSNVAFSGTSTYGNLLYYYISDSVTTISGTTTIDGSGDFSASGINLSSLSDGVITLTVNASDADGNLSNTAETSTVKDTILPTSTVNTIVSPTNTSTQTISGTKSAGSSVWVNGTQIILADGLTTWSFVKNLSVGINTLNIISIDENGNQSVTSTVAINYDNSIPAVSFGSLPALSTSDNSTNITIGGTGVVIYKYQLDSGAISAEIAVSNNLVLSSLSASAHTLSVWGKNLAGTWQTTSSDYTWTVTSNGSVGGGGGSGGSGGNSGGGSGGSIIPVLPVVPTDPTIQQKIIDQTNQNNTASGVSEIAKEKVLGVKIYANGSYLRGVGNKLYILELGQKKYLGKLALKYKTYKSKKVLDVTVDVLSAYPDWRAEGTLMRAPDNKIYVLEKGMKRHITTIAELKSKKYKGKKINNLSQEILDLYPTK